MIFRPDPLTNTRTFVWILTAIAIVGIGLPIGLAIMSAWGGTTLFYDITPQSVHIHFGPQVTTIDRADIDDVYIVENPSRGRRIAGTNISGLKQGRWSFQETGRITLYATETAPLLVIETDDEKWGINPSDPDRFRQLIESGESGSFKPDPQFNPTSFVVIMLTILLIGGIPIILILVYVVRMTRNLKYELSDDALIIHGGKSPTVLPYTEITDTRIANPKGVPFRLFGIGMPGLHWGAYSWKDAGPGLKMYATQLRPIVLISAGEKTYGITPEQREQFVNELERRLPST